MLLPINSIPPKTAQCHAQSRLFPAFLSSSPSTVSLEEEECGFKGSTLCLRSETSLPTTAGCRRVRAETTNDGTQGPFPGYHCLPPSMGSYLLRQQGHSDCSGLTAQRTHTSVHSAVFPTSPPQLSITKHRYSP